VTFGGRFYYTESAFQSEPSGESYEKVEAVFPGYGYNQIREALVHESIAMLTLHRWIITL